MRLILYFFLLFSCSVKADIVFECLGSSHTIQDYVFPKEVFLEKQNNSFFISLKNKNKNTLNFSKKYNIELEDYPLLFKDGEKNVKTVSKKEIILAMSTNGRTFTFSGSDCGVNDFEDHVGIRQNIVAWTENTKWNFPEGTSSKWNPVYWTLGIPNQNVKLSEAFLNIFHESEKYSLGCYSVVVTLINHGFLDYYSRVKPNAKKLALVEKTIIRNGKPFDNVEGDDFPLLDESRFGKEIFAEGKLIVSDKNVSARHFIPGDWVYFVNPDPLSRQHQGYEGSNAIYFGRDRFNDFYQSTYDNYFTFEEEIKKIYLWRNGVFNYIRDTHKIEKISRKKLEKLTLPPSNGGVLLSQRGNPILNQIDIPKVAKLQ